MKKIIKFIIILSLLAYSQSFAATVWYYNNHLAPYTNPWSSNLWWMWPNMWTFCDDDWDWDWIFNRVSSANNSTTTDPESWLLSSVPAAWTMRCLYYDAVAPTWVDSYDLSRLNTDQEITVTIQCADTWWSWCDTDTNDSVNSGSLGWTVSWLNTYKKVCTWINLSWTVTISNTSSCAWPITFRDKSWRTTNFTYQISWPTPSLPQLVSTKLKIKWIAQSSSNTNAAWIKTNDATANANVKDNFSKISKLNLKTTILKNIDKLLKSVDRKSTWYSSVSFNLNNINGQNIDIVSWSKKIYYFKDKDVTINAWVNFINNKNITIIIERWNLFIKWDISYQNWWMLWLILLWNKDWTKSNVYVDENITNWAWILYTDWTVQSTYNIAWSDNNIYTSANINDRWLNQLYWKWSFISQNTVWWSIWSAKCPYWSVNYKSCATQDTARKYDLLFFRRYSLLDWSKYYWITDTSLTPFTSTSVPFWSSSKTIYISGWRGYMKSGANLSPIVAWNWTHQDKNISNSFILDYDSRITWKSAPLWFSSN